MLRCEEVDVRFGGVQALREATLEVGAGSITGLIGPNGAGKTTLFNVACGLVRADRGRVMLGEHDLTSLAPHRRARLGLGRTFQRLEVFGSLSVLDNVRVAADIKRWTSDDNPDARSIVDRVGLRAVAGERADALPTGLARLVELARALATHPKVLLLDEPSSGLDDRETDAFAGVLASLADEGLAMLLVEHDVDLVMRVCERIHVLDFGRVIASGTPDEVRVDPTVQAAYLGTLEDA